MEWLCLKRLAIPSVDKDVEKLALTYTASGMHNGQPLWKTVWQVLRKSNINL